MRFARVHRLDLALALLAVVVLATSLGESLEHVRYAAALTSAALLVLLGRSWRPPTASLLGFAILALGGQIAPQITASMFVAILASFAVAGSLARRQAAIVAWAAGCVAMVATMIDNPYVEGAGDIALTLTFCTIIWGAGLLAAERGRQAGAAHQRAELAESSRDLDVAAATAHERTRIAGELHDIVSHGLSIVILQTVAARMSLHDQAPEPLPSRLADADRRLDAVESTAREALDDMRRMLDLLRPSADEPTEPEVPSVGLAQVPALVDKARSAGLPVEVELDTRGGALPVGLDAAAYRIVQEALTNVLKHAPGAATRVRVDRADSRVQVSVRNRSAGAPAASSGWEPRGSGYGLIGMRQRTELYGGTFSAGVCENGYRVEATFPLGRAT